MKILQVFNEYLYRGGEEVWVEQVPRLLSGVADVVDLRFRSADWVSVGRPSRIRQAMLIWDNPAARARLRTAVTSHRPDLLLLHNVLPVASIGIYREAEALGLPVMQYMHNYRPFSPGGALWAGSGVTAAPLHGNPWPEILAGGWQGSRVKTAVLAWHLRRAARARVFDTVARWLAPSAFMREKFIEGGIAPEKVRVVQHCWQVAEEAGELREGRHYLYLGRFAPEKGVHDLIAAWRWLERELGARCPDLLLAGKGPEQRRLQRQAQRSRRVRVVGFVRGAEKARLIETCRALVVPSIWWEPLGLTVYEAYARRRPVIAARAGALRETVRDGVTGWTHAPGDVRGVAQAVAAAESAGLGERGRRGAAGRAWLKVAADPEQWRRRFIALCEECMASRS